MYKIRWLFPNEQYFENFTSNVSEFLLLLQRSDYVTYEGIMYQVSAIELMIEEQMWLSILLDQA
ncbi:hypothetical protein [Longirhabdus pacifica]|uniref:hypothetical protein n=1 Tax=Longirhabdus pacifica TaxID=2305227 RepID=UPI001008F53A|nr:hypothetical protein [Longirhabdus pacifica]